MNREELEIRAAARMELYRRESLDRKFWSYCLYMDFDFFSKRKILEKVAAVFQYVADAYFRGESVWVSISVPPRTGKSYLASLFCSFMLGLAPEESVMRNTCTATLYDKLSKDTRLIVTSEAWRSIFCHKLRTKGVKTWDLAESRQSSYFGGGVGGTIIGFGASMLDITDDLYKNYRDSMSDTQNEKVLEWADSNRRSRKEKNCCRIDIGTRWRTNDYIGRNEKMGIYDKVLVIPALIDEKSFCEDVRSTKDYLKERIEVSTEIWSAEYMQLPIDIKGRLFSPDDMQWFDEIPDHDVSANIGVCDSADTGRDYLSFPMCQKIGEKYYIYDWIFTQEPMTITEYLIRGAIKTNGMHSARFESNNGGKLFAKNVAEDANGCSVSWRTTSANKETRILTDAEWIKKNFVFRNTRIDKDGHPIMGEYDRAIQQLISYVKGATNQKDDAPDSLSMLRRFIEELGLNYVQKVADNREAWDSIPITISQVRV